MPTIGTRLLTGAGIATVLEDLASLRLEIFREYPYLYRGERADELAYLLSYAKIPEACVLLARVGEQVIGAATGMPLAQEDARLRDAFLSSGLPLDDVYYVGELLLRPAYRNRGLGRQLLARLESHLSALGRFRILTCATVERPEDHPLRPADYRPISRFLGRTGFARLDGVTTTFSWRETDGERRAHVMQFWSRSLLGAEGLEEGA